MNCDDIAIFGGGGDKDNGTRGLWIYRPPRHWPRRPRQYSSWCSRTWYPEVTDPRATQHLPHDPNLWLADFPLQAAGMALASWRPPGLPQQPPEVSRPCQKQLSPRSHLLQVVSEALDIPVQQQHHHQHQCQQEQLLGVALQTPEVVETSKIFEISRQSSPTPPPTPSKTNVVTASDGQISNGFVLHGQNLPYVFEEATDPSGKSMI